MCPIFFHILSDFIVSSYLEKYNLQYLLNALKQKCINGIIVTFIHKTEQFIKRLRWKVFWHKNKDVKRDEQKETFNFKSFKTPPKDSELEKFEVMGIFETVEFDEII